jgi:hypothetical protein
MCMEGDVWRGSLAALALVGLVMLPLPLPLLGDMLLLVAVDNTVWSSVAVPDLSWSANRVFLMVLAVLRDGLTAG